MSPAAAAGPADRDVAAPADVVVDVVTANGSGCPPGTAAATVLPGNSSVTVTYSAYTAKVGPGAADTDFRKNCQLNVAVTVPAGVTYAIGKADHLGFASIAAGAGGVHRANHFFTGQPQKPYLSHAMAGPVDDAWMFSDEVSPASVVWAPCGTARNVNLNTELRVQAGASDTRSTLTMDSTVYHLMWAQCP